MIKLTRIQAPPNKKDSSLRNLMRKHFPKGIFCFVLNESENKKTILLPTDKSMDYFHLVNIDKEGIVNPLAGPISRLELSIHFDFNQK